MSDAARATVEADPARAFQKMLSKMDDEDKEAFNLWHRMTKNWCAREAAEQTAALRAALRDILDSDHVDDVTLPGHVTLRVEYRIMNTARALFPEGAP